MCLWLLAEIKKLTEVNRKEEGLIMNDELSRLKRYIFGVDKTLYHIAYYVSDDETCYLIGTKKSIFQYLIKEVHLANHTIEWLTYAKLLQTINDLTQYSNNQIIGVVLLTSGENEDTKQAYINGYVCSVEVDDDKLGVWLKT